MLQIFIFLLKNLVLIHTEELTLGLRLLGCGGERVGNDLFGSQAATLTRGGKVKEKTDTQLGIDDALYELPDNPELELGDGLIEILGNDAEDLYQVDNITKEEEEDLVLEKIKEEYGF